jgi:hypothetical protein
VCVCVCVCIVCLSIPTVAPGQGAAHLGLDLLGRVSEEDGGVGVTGTHLGLGPLQSREEGRVQQSWLRISNPGGDIPCHPKVRVLWGEGLDEDVEQTQPLANEQPQRSSWETLGLLLVSRDGLILPPTLNPTSQ